jgi:hypothetical protein
MSYSMRENSSGGSAKSHLTGKTVSWVHDRAGVNKRAAINELKQHDQQVRSVNNARAAPIIGRELSEAEHAGKRDWLPDNRTTAEKVRADAVHKSQKRHDPDRNPHAARIAELEAGLATAFRPVDRNRLQRRLAIAHAESTRFDNRLAERKAWEALKSAPRTQDALVDANAWLARLQTNSAVPQSWVNDARKRLNDLQLTCDTESYWRDTLAFEAVREQTLCERAKSADAEAAKHRAEAAELRREKNADHPEPPAPEVEAEPAPGGP